MKNAWRMMALGSALSVTAMTAPSMMGMGFAGAQDQDRQDHHDYTQQQAHEYSSNRYYQMGNREGYVDYQHKQRKEHNHKYRNDGDRKAHDYGYQQGWQGQSYSSDRNHDQDDHR
jgi:hypothetical protein